MKVINILLLENSINVSTKNCFTDMKKKIEKSLVFLHGLDKKFLLTSCRPYFYQGKYIKIFKT